MDDFMDYSPVPMVVRIRFELNNQGMKFVDDGLPSAIVNEKPVACGVTRSWEVFSTPGVRYIKQIL